LNYKIYEINVSKNVFKIRAKIFDEIGYKLRKILLYDIK